MGIPLRQVLSDFGLAAPDADSVAVPAAAGVASPPQIDIESERERELSAAFARGEEQGRAAARAELEQELEQQRAATDARVAEERERWVAEQGQPLASALTAAVEELEAGIAGAVARVLGPFLKAEARDRMTAALTERVRALLSGRDGAPLTISGPADLLDAMKTGLGETRTAVDFQPADGPDVRVSVGDTVIETAIAEWWARLDEVTR